MTIDCVLVAYLVTDNNKNSQTGTLENWLVLCITFRSPILLLHVAKV